MREILFRGKAINREKGYHKTKYKNNEWVYGIVSRLYDERFKNLPAEMTNTDGVSGIDIDYKTVGQYTGLTDKNGTKIFEGDILSFSDRLVYVYWQENCGCWDCRYIKSIGGKATSHEERNPNKWKFATVVIGNIHDNSELLEGGIENV
ncbi:MAG: hypothetical protein IJ447_02045 [Clostridia bacterium]|nr:hypothetical protein [Clostridia bacterium]